MSSISPKQRLIERLLDEARERWGEKEARLLRPALERVAGAIFEVEGFELDPGEEP